MTAFLNRYFALEAHRSSLRREFVAGLTTFLTMAYIIVVNPAILAAAGIPQGPSTTATILIAVAGTLGMGLYARRPFAVAPYMGENAFLAFTVVKVLGFSWQEALGAVFLAGVLFVLLTVARIRPWLVNAIPVSLRHSFAVGIGLFLTLIGLNEAGIVSAGASGAPLRVGALLSPAVLVAMFAFVLIEVLLIRRVPGAILWGMLAATGAGFLFHLHPLPQAWLSPPPSLAPILLQFRLHGLLGWSSLGVVFTIFILAFVDTAGTLIGVSARAGLLDEQGQLPQIERPMLVDAFSTVLAAVLGTSTSGAFIESAAGVAAGGRTGLTAVVTALFFALSLFAAPLLTRIPPEAYGPALVVVGLMMLAPVTRIPFDDATEAIPSLTAIALMSFTYNIGIGIMAGFLLYPLCKLAGGRARTLSAGVWVLAGLALAFFAFYPYR